MQRERDLLTPVLDRDERPKTPQTLQNRSSPAFSPTFNSKNQQLASNNAKSPSIALFIPSGQTFSYLSGPLSPLTNNSGNLLFKSHRLSLSFFGEEFSYDLDMLENDPAAIIELLKAIESEKHNWMVVGAHYRRIGNAMAAVSVIEALISCKSLRVPVFSVYHLRVHPPEVMTAQGHTESDLKPAYLLLSGCEIDIAKRIKATQPVDAEKHYKRSQALLQKVYGTLEVPDSKQPCIISTASSLRLLCSPDTSVNETLPSADARRNSYLERELSKLRKDLNEQKTLLAEMRTLKRKLEDDVAYERSGRRRLLRDFDALQKELENARKMENHALSQVKREVDARRKAEESARSEKGMRQELQNILEKSSK
ncbi:hypothetical protein H0H93_007804 [Arthromyces matolae]|nr:hypothetical protein H0H93_007804 [Arthromyces matolae]